MFAILILIGFAIGWKSTGDVVVGRTMAFVILSLTQIFHSFNMRSSHSLFRIGIPFKQSAISCSADIAGDGSCRCFYLSFRHNFRIGSTGDAGYVLALLLSLVPIPVIGDCEVDWTNSPQALTDMKPPVSGSALLSSFFVRL